MADRYEEKARIIVSEWSGDIPSRRGMDVLVGRIASALRDQDAWHEIDDPEHPAPRDGTPIDLWVIGDPQNVEFLTDQSVRSADRVSREGRLTNWRWGGGDWCLKTGLTPLYGLRMYDCVAIHWRPLPAPPLSGRKGE